MVFIEKLSAIDLMVGNVNSETRLSKMSSRDISNFSLVGLSYQTPYSIIIRFGILLGKNCGNSFSFLLYEPLGHILNLCLAHEA